MLERIMIIHGGAGKWRKERLMRAKKALLDIASEIKKRFNKKNVIDLVEFAIKRMELDETFNAGRGAALNLLGEVELDAGIMTSDGMIGAVAAVRNVMHPISLAKIVMNELDHILLVGEGAERIAKLYNLYNPSNELKTDYSYVRWIKAIKEITNYLTGGEIRDDLIKYYLREIFPKILEFIKKNPEFLEQIKEKYSSEISDTVGAVASDGETIVAGVSTGGIFLKIPGRVGDSPILGAGFYANKNGGCVATGHGEKIMRSLLCYRVVNYLEKYSAVEAARKILDEFYSRIEIRAGLIIVDKNGDWGVYHTTEKFPVAIVLDDEVIVKDYWRD